MAGQGTPEEPAALSGELSELSHNSSQRGLNLNAPLLSVRRHASTALRPTNFVNDSYQLYKQDSEERSKKASSDLTLESLRSPGTVPFLWEQSPGRPKSNGNTLSTAVQSFTPCLPPCRASPLHVAALGRASPSHNVKNENPKSISGRSCKPKADCPLPLYPRKAAAEEKLPSFGNLLQRSDSYASNTSDCDVFSDAVDTFVHTESPTDHTDRTSCLGGHDSAGVAAGRTDPRARDFIMRRFLPAAQAMVTESPASLFPEKCVLRKGQQPALPVKTRASRPVAYRMHQRKLISAQVDDADVEDAENACVFPSKACGIFASFRFGAAIRHLLPQSSAGTVKSTEKSHSVKSSRRISQIDPLESQNNSFVTFINEEFLQGSNSDEEDYLCDVKERHGSHSQSNRSRLNRTLIETRGISSQLPFRAAYLEKNVRDSIQADQNRLYHLAHKHEAKGFLGIPQDKIVKRDLGSIKKPQSSSIASVTTELERIRLAQTHGLTGKGCANSNAIFSLEVNFAEAGAAAGRDMRVTEGECLKNCKRNQSASCSHSAIDSEDINSDAVKDPSIVNPVEQGWPLRMSNYACLSTGMDNKLSEAKELPATSPKATTKGSYKKVHWQEETLITPNSVRPSLPPLPKSPSQPWQWRSVLAASPSSSPLAAYTPPRNMYNKIQPADTSVRRDGTASWEERVKSASVQTGHLRYSDELFNKPSVADVDRVQVQNNP